MMGFDATYPNLKDDDGNTPLHIAVIRYAQEKQQFAEYKRIIKELLFNGASRDAKVRSVVEVEV